MSENKKHMVIFPLLLVLYEISNYLSNDAYLPALPDLTRDLGINNNLAQLTLTAFFMGTATMQLIFGPVIDRVGRRPVMCASGVLFISGCLVCAMTHDIHLFLLARFAQGSAVTAMLVAGYATVHELLDQQQAIKTLAWMGGITILAPAFGPLFGAMILLISGWRTIFIILAIWSGVVLVGLIRVMPETCPEFKPIRLKLLFQAYWRVITNINFMRPVLALCTIFTLMIAWIAAGPFMVMEHFHHTPVTFGLLQALIFSCYIVGTVTVNRFVGKLSLNKLLCMALILPLCAATGSLFLSFFWHDYLFDIIVPMMGIAIGCGMSFPILNRLAIEGSDEPMGIRMAIFSSAMGLSGVVGSALVGSSYFDGQISQFAILLFVFCLIQTALYLPKLRWS